MVRFIHLILNPLTTTNTSFTSFNFKSTHCNKYPFMTDSWLFFHREKLDAFYLILIANTNCRLASYTEWKMLYILCKDENGLLHKDTVRGVYDGSLFERMAKERELHLSNKKSAWSLIYVVTLDSSNVKTSSYWPLVIDIYKLHTCTFELIWMINIWLWSDEFDPYFYPKSKSMQNIEINIGRIWVKAGSKHLSCLKINILRYIFHGLGKIND